MMQGYTISILQEQWQSFWILKGHGMQQVVYLTTFYPAAELLTYFGVVRNATYICF